MTEERFEQIVESAAGKFDKSMNRAWSHRPVRFLGKAVSFLTGAGLIVSAIPLAEKGSQTASKACLISGGVIVVAELATLVIFKRKK